MKLFYFKGTCSLAPHIALYASGMKFSVEQIDRITKMTPSGDFHKFNPKGYVPALVLDNGEVLTEGAVILQYIADQAPEKNLIPKSGLERYRAQEWLNFIATELHKGFGVFFHAKAPEDYKNFMKDRVAGRLTHVETQLSKNEYILGSQFSVADAYLFTVLSWTKGIGFDLAAFPSIQKYFTKLASHPAVAAAMKAEGLV